MTATRENPSCCRIFNGLERRDAHPVGKSSPLAGRRCRDDSPVAQRIVLCYNSCMKTYVHARLATRDRAILEELRRSTGCSESELVRLGLQLVLREQDGRQSALDLAGKSVGRFKMGPRDLAANKSHLDDFGQ